MDYNEQSYHNNDYYTQPAPPKKSSGLAIASMTCGIVSLIACCVGLSLPLGALAILFAILSRRKGQPVPAMSVAGIVTGAIGLLMGILLYIFSLFIWQDPQFQKEVYSSFEEVYGEEMADTMSEIYGFDLDEIK